MYCEILFKTYELILTAYVTVKNVRREKEPWMQPRALHDLW